MTYPTEEAVWTTNPDGSETLQIGSYRGTLTRAHTPEFGDGFYFATEHKGSTFGKIFYDGGAMETKLGLKPAVVVSFRTFICGAIRCGLA